MQYYSAELCALKNISLHTSFDQARPEKFKLALEKRKNIYLIFKEALNNALKYAGCQNLWLEIVISGNELFMQVKDDGKGFNDDETFPGNGLRHMRQRAAEIGATLAISSLPGNGTEVKFRCGV